MVNRRSPFVPENEVFMRYLHAMVRVADLESALDFYCHKLGLVETRRMESQAGRFTLIYLAAPGDKARAYGLYSLP